jgi:hypothetical protein
MPISLNDALAALRPEPNSHSAQVTLAIHSQAKNDVANRFYGHKIYYGYGYMKYFTEATIGRRVHAEHLATYGAFKVLNNVSYSVDNQVSGEWGEQQTFIVKYPMPENWYIRIDPRPRLVAPDAQPPQLTVTLLERPDRAPWSLDLTEDNAFLRGIGPDPISPNDKALYSVAFVGIMDQIQWPCATANDPLERQGSSGS